MTILSAQTIQARALGDPPRHRSEDEWRLVIRPFSERAVFNGMSYGLSACGYDVRIKDAVTIYPGHSGYRPGFVLATTVEYFEFPTDVRGVLADKSSWARRGLAVQNTRFEPGWRGYPTVEISNHGHDIIQIPAGAPIAQMEFGLLDQPSEQPYVGKYQDQPQRPVEAIDEGN